jgi:hypothetical protein
MPVKDTHSYAKSAGGPMRHYWTEEDDQLYTQLRIDDVGDSVSFVVSAKEKGMYTPSVTVEVGVRMTYADLEKLIAHGQEILRERGQ